MTTTLPKLHCSPFLRFIETPFRIAIPLFLGLIARVSALIRFPELNFTRIHGRGVLSRSRVPAP